MQGGVSQHAGAEPLTAIRTIRGKLGYDKAIEKSCERMGYRKETLLGILHALEEIAEPLETMEQFAARLKFLEGRMKQSRGGKAVDAVTLSTLHSAKGLEFARVYVVDLIEGVLPSSDDVRKWEAGDANDMEEAARLFYVGMTRAKRRLELISYAKKEGESVKPSRFVEDVRQLQRKASVSIPSRAEAVHPRSVSANPNAIHDLSQLVVGAKIQHAVFGEGEIILTLGDSMDIRFREETKRLSSTSACRWGCSSRRLRNEPTAGNWRSRTRGAVPANAEVPQH